MDPDAGSVDEPQAEEMQDSKVDRAAKVAADLARREAEAKLPMPDQLVLLVKRGKISKVKAALAAQLVRSHGPSGQGERD